MTPRNTVDNEPRRPTWCQLAWTWSSLGHVIWWTISDSTCSQCRLYIYIWYAWKQVVSERVGWQPCSALHESLMRFIKTASTRCDKQSSCSAGKLVSDVLNIILSRTFTITIISIYLERRNQSKHSLRPVSLVHYYCNYCNYIVYWNFTGRPFDEYEWDRLISIYLQLVISFLGLYINIYIYIYIYFRQVAFSTYL